MGDAARLTRQFSVKCHKQLECLNFRVSWEHGKVVYDPNQLQFIDTDYISDLLLHEKLFKITVINTIHLSFQFPWTRLLVLISLAPVPQGFSLVAVQVLTMAAVILRPTWGVIYF